MMIAKRRLLLAVFGCLAALGGARAEQGIGATEIAIGTIQDLSGPIAAFGKQTRNGLQMRVDEANAQGGINGRKIRLFVEDSGYDPKKALLAAQKLATEDKVFAILAHIGTAANMAAMPVQFEHDVINFLPLTGAREMYEPPSKLKLSSAPSYYDQIRTSLAYLVPKKGYKRVGILYQDDEFGLEVVRGTEAELKALGLQLIERASFKRGATDFSSQIARLKAANCDLVVLATIIRETVGSIVEARKSGFNPDFVGTSALYTHLIHTLGGPAVDGLYGTNSILNPYSDDESQAVRDWAAKYKEKFGEDPAVFSVYGYDIADVFCVAAAKAGANLTLDSFNAAIESTIFRDPLFGGPDLRFTAKDRLGTRKVHISQIVNSKWKAITPLMDPPAE
ncbi:MAG TPA: ABC transporter substrate-binding protein [Burkholderiaceae bacterium]|nr:ABC transporter substrate-binding protein [Burkholderiaceae bacterium]